MSSLSRNRPKKPKQKLTPTQKRTPTPTPTQKLEITYIAPDKLRPSPHNARTHSSKQIGQLTSSVIEYGVVNPILIDENNRIIAGHGRHAAATALGLEKVPTIRVRGLNEARRRALALADNKLPLGAGWDTEMLTAEIKYLSTADLDFDISVTGFDTLEIDDLLIDATKSSPREDTCPEPSGTVAISQPGDMWKLGNHRVLCGDSTDVKNFRRLLGRERARMAFLGIPYNVPIAGHVSGLGRRRHREFVQGSGEMSPDAFTKFIARVLGNCAMHSLDGAILFACMDWRHMHELETAARAAKLTLKNLVVWVKSNAGMGTFYRSEHELISVFKNGNGRHINNFGLGGGGRYRTNVWQYPGCNSFGPERTANLDKHPTPKPVALVSDAIRDVSNRGDIVLDCFGGSGTTLIAAEKTGRRARLIELDPLYVDVIVRRWEAVTGAKARHVETRKTLEQTKKERT